MAADRGGRICARAGPTTIALRADIDGLPVVESEQPFLFASKKPIDSRQEVGRARLYIDTIAAILMATAQVLSRNENEPGGLILFMFQPAEEGAPRWEEGGRPLMIWRRRVGRPLRYGRAWLAHQFADTVGDAGV